MSDADGDSTMHDQSSPDFDDPEEMFPDADNPSTPRHLPLQASSELSPPDSQGPTTRERPNPSASTAIASPLTELVNSSRKRARTEPENGAATTRSHPNAEGNPANAEQGGRAPSGYSWAKEEDEPGFAWRNKKAQEDYQRAMESIVDKERMILTKYGDVLAPRNA